MKESILPWVADLHCIPEWLRHNLIITLVIIRFRFIDCKIHISDTSLADVMPDVQEEIKDAFEASFPSCEGNHQKIIPNSNEQVVMRTFRLDRGERGRENDSNRCTCF